ncbi:hypothetical protein [Helcococcus kunzii]|uniref:hypothetical protein n=1 Tax=Helcococcus kunzii TaxID=40091 RepID=UPI0024AE7815|nr:hypothetical protein [Helcococcus kunzii]
MEQTYIKLRDISLYLFILFLLISLFIWFKFNILETWRDLSGANSNKYLKELRKQNELNKPNSIHHPIDLNISDTNTSPMKVKTGEMEEAYNKKMDDMRLDKHTNPFENKKEYQDIDDKPIKNNTEVLTESKANNTEVLKNDRNNFNTDVLNDNSYNTEVLEDNQDEVSYETTILSEESKNTADKIQVYIIEEKEFVGSNKTV